MITRNEAHNIQQALRSVAFADEIIVVDHQSTDQTPALARSFGANVVQTPDWPGFGSQKNRALDLAKGDWVLSLDADEWLSDELAVEIRKIITDGSKSVSVDAYWIRRSSVFIDKRIYFGDWRGDKVLRLFRRTEGKFTSDLVHERLEVNGASKALFGELMHWPIRALNDSRRKMWRYNVAASKQLAQQKTVSWRSPWIHAGWSIFRGLLLKLGLLDGRRGIQLAWFNAKGAFIRYEAALRRQNPKQILGLRRMLAYMNLFFIDHGILRNFYDNRFALPGSFYRSNQPSPARLFRYQKKFQIKTVINLRGANPQLGWYRLEAETCNSLGVTLINTQVHSRGLPTRERIHELKVIIETMELPALTHCKSGADRAGIFSVLYRHFRLLEPIESAKNELHWRFGHFRSAKTGILDHFFDQYLSTRLQGQSFIEWVDTIYDREIMEKNFKPRDLANFFVDIILRRE